MTEQKYCESCGMPLRGAQDFGGGRPDNKYCAYCCDEQGNLKPYEEVLAQMKFFVVQNMGVSESEALMSAKENMAKMPAWAGQN